MDAWGFQEPNYREQGSNARKGLRCSYEVVAPNYFGANKLKAHAKEPMPLAHWEQQNEPHHWYHSVYPPPPISGCMYPSATNFDVNATVDDGSCLFPEPTTENHTNVTNNTSIVEEEGDSEVQDSAGLSSSMMTYGLIAASISLLVILVIIAGTMFLRQRSRAQMFSEFINEDKDNY